jgi:hypothetical protein
VWFSKNLSKVVDFLAVDLHDFSSLNIYWEGMMKESKIYVRKEEINRVKNKLIGNLWYYITENFVGTYTVSKYRWLWCTRCLAGMRWIRNAYGVLLGHYVVKQPLESVWRRWEDYSKWILGVIFRIRGVLNRLKIVSSEGLG